MHCPFCQHEDTRVIDSRVTEDGSTIRSTVRTNMCREQHSTITNAHTVRRRPLRGSSHIPNFP